MIDIRAVACALITMLATHATAAPPNIVLIISDDQHYGDYGFMGHPHIETPHIDRLAAQSMVWTEGRVTTSLCCPSLATIITGQYPRTHGITGNTPGTSHDVFAHANETYIDRMSSARTLPRLLAERGYVSQQTGKWWHGGWQTGGFTDGMTHGVVERGGRHGDAGLAIGRDGLTPIADFVDGAMRDEKPFFVWYAPFLPHTPHNPPARLLAMYEPLAPTKSIAKYWAMCTWFDETVGALRDVLDERGVADDTVVVYVTDNGWINRRDASRYAPRSKRSPYDGGLRTPIMVHWPGHVAPGRSDALACSIDLAPTILTLAGVDVPAELPGVDLLDSAAIEARSVLHGVVYSHDAVDYAEPGANWEYRWCVADGWKLITPNTARLPGAATQLYKIVDDAHEQNDLAAAMPEVVERLSKSIEAWMSE